MEIFLATLCGFRIEVLPIENSGKNISANKFLFEIEKFGKMSIRKSFTTEQITQ